MMVGAVSEVVKAIGHAITRDLIYVVGGSVIVASFLYAFGRFSTEEMPMLLQLFLAGISYVLGYAAQETFGFLRITSTEHPPSPPRWAVFLFRRFTHKDWVTIDVKTYQLAEDAFFNRNQELGERVIERVNRIIMLKQVGATMGACGAVALVILVIHAVLTWAVFDICLSVGVLIATAVFISISWVKRLDESSVKVQLAGQLKTPASTRPNPEDEFAARPQPPVILQLIPSTFLARLSRCRGRRR